VDQALERLVGQVINTEYFDFRKDLLDQFLRERNVYLPGEAPPLSVTSSDIGVSKRSRGRAPRTNDSRSVQSPASGAHPGSGEGEQGEDGEAQPNV